MPYNRKRRKILAGVTVFNILVIGCPRQLDWRLFNVKADPEKIHLAKLKN